MSADKEREQAKQAGLQVVVAVDDTKQSKRALEVMLDLLDDSAELELLHARCKRSNPEAVSNNFRPFVDKERRIQRLSMLDESGKQTVKQRVCDYVNSRDKRVDLLVTGSHEVTAPLPVNSPRTPRSRQTRLKSVLGSVSEQSIRSAHCSSLIVPRMDDMPSLHSGWLLVLGVDGSENAHFSFRFVLSLLRPKQTLFVVHVETPASNEESVAEPLRSKQVIAKYTRLVSDEQERRPDCRLEFATVFDPNVSDALISFSREVGAQLICVGADGLTRQIMGSVSDGVVRKSEKMMTLVTQMSEYSHSQCNNPQI